MIELTNITKAYTMGDETIYALHDVSTTIEKGEFVAIMGPSGSGKSTLMNIIGCLDLPSDGTYKLDGLDVSDMNDDAQARVRNQRIGFVFQRFNLLPRVAAVRQVALPLMYSGVSNRERTRRAQESLTAVGLAERAHHRPDELSGGQQQRVAIARALVTNPSIILADEPTGALDSKTGAEVMALFNDLHQRGLTVIMVTHDADVAAHAQRTIHIKDGQIA